MFDLLHLRGVPPSQIREGRAGQNKDRACADDTLGALANFK
jgi:hypothetical protein